MSHPLTIVRTVAGWFTNLLLVAVVLGCAAYVAPGLFGYERYVITGGSMSGTFEKGSLAFEKRVPVVDLEVGDVITYLPPADSGVSTLVTHRLTSIEPGEGGTRVMRTQGDANPDPDPWEFSLTAPTQPVVVRTVPHLGHVFIALANPQVRILVIGGPAALIALLALRDLIQALRSHAPGSHSPGSHSPGSHSPGSHSPRAPSRRTGRHLPASA